MMTRKVMKFLPILLLCGCITTSEKTNSPAEPELAIKSEIKEPAIKQPPAKKSTEATTEQQNEPGVTVINLETPEKKITPVKNPVVLIRTSKGDIKVELDREDAPITVENFLNYVDMGFYTNTIFHRVIANFMIQGGGLTADMMPKKTNPPIKNEADNGLSNKRGTIAMARTNMVDSATSQFFINVRDNTPLDNKGPSAALFGYCVFGKVIEGMNVVDEIRNVTTCTRGYMRDVPVDKVVIKEITLVKPEQ